MKICIAFDKFKYSLTAAEAGKIAADVVRSCTECVVQVVSFSDGGEGFAATLIDESTGGVWHEVEVHNARMRKIRTGFAMIPAAGINRATRQLLQLSPEDQVGIVEMAQAAGLVHLTKEERNPWRTTSYGVGELLSAAAEQGATRILIGLGGSATNDAGAGALAALGLHFDHKPNTSEQPFLPVVWDKVCSVSLQSLRPLPPLLVATDVTNPLLGPDGATRVYGGQKGLSDKDMTAMDRAVGYFAQALLQASGRDASLLAEAGSGAAGGLGFGLRALYNAEYIEGGRLVESWLDMERRLDQCDVLISGEGRLDPTSLQGKGPAGLMVKALRRGKIVHLFCGSIDSQVADELKYKHPNLFLHAITPSAMGLDQALSLAPSLLRQAVLAAFS